MFPSRSTLLLVFLLPVFSSTAFSQSTVALLNVPELRLLPQEENAFSRVSLYDEEVLPFELVRGMIYVAATVDGRAGRYLLDTGAPRLVLNVDHLTAAAQRDVESHQAMGSGGHVDIGRTTVERLEWAGRTWKSPAALVLSMAHFEEAGDQHIDGIIGYEQFQDRELLFDYDNSVLRLHAADQPVNRRLERPRLTFILEFYDHLPIITLVRNGRRLRFAVDSGAAANLIDPVALSQSERNELSENMTGAVQLRGLDGNANSVRAATITDWEDTTLHLDEQRFLLKSLDYLSEDGRPFDGILGYEFLRANRVSIDYPNKRLYVW